MCGFKECSSCEALYNKSCGCSKGGFIDKFVRDPNKTPDSSQRPPHDCPKCGNPVDSLHCRQCALLRKKLKEVWFTICDEHKILQDFLSTFESSNDDSNVVNAPQETFVFNQDPVKILHKVLYILTTNVVTGVIPLCYDDDDDKESSTSLKDIIIFELPPCIAITLILSTKETKGSLIMGDEHLDTIPKKESDEFIKSSVENLIPNPSESGDLSNIGRECDVPVCDDFTTFSNLLFDADNNFPSSDDESFSDEDISKEIYSNPLFDEEIISIKINPHHFDAESDLIESLLNQDSSIISSSKIDSLLDEFADELIFLKSIPPGIDEANCDPEEEIRLIEKLLYDNSCPRLPKEFNSKNSDAVIESFSPSFILVEDSDPFME
nr:hypothetical protein [Tanacetum cinerariifolium]